MFTLTLILILSSIVAGECVWRVRDLTRRVERLEAEVRHVDG